MSLENAMTELAKAMNRYSDTIEKYGDSLLARVGEIETTATTDKTEAAAAPKKGPGRPKKTEAPKVVEDDGLGGEEEEEEEEEAASRTSDEVKAILQKFKAAGGAPKDIMSKFNAKAFPEIKEADFDAVYEATEKALKKLG